ncbi:zinc ribbon domain-containing protein [Candidatus Bathyarchaeota archaeon]|nr:zinc ribbon domain-containing protein [Candidatus Bathyarchaeota archaeon]
MPEPFYQLLKPFIWPRYYEEGPPRYIDIAFLSRDYMDTNGKVKEPLKSIIDLVILGYRPITSLSILSILVENQNKPMYGSQIGAQLEKKFQIPKGWFTKTRYYDTRIGKLLKILQRQNILEETKVKDWKTNKEYVGYRITENIYPTAKEKILPLHQGRSLSILTPPTTINIPKGKAKTVKHCPKCNALITSASAKYCELCGTFLITKCPNCGKEISLEYTFCLNCGQRFE